VPRPLRVGVQLPETERPVGWPELVRMARAAEAVGFDSIWLGDHLLYRGDGGAERGPWEMWTMLAGLAAVTERVDLGPLVACTAFHPPGLIAKMATGIDEISDGRFVLGLGAGWNEPEFRAFGLPTDRLVSRFEEAFTIIRGLVDGERVTLEGTYAVADDLVLHPAPTRKLRLMVGSTGPRMLRITLPHVDAWNTWYDDFENQPRKFAELRRHVLDAAERIGRDPASLRSSGCLSVSLGSGPTARPRDNVIPIGPGASEVAAALMELAESGADEAILVVNPITEGSITALGEALALIDA
jgi:alkanesulfonate monooxygenase SsuD/methylene tetrahydromethanopterin reductase-like flavin-dependent oxidoreductase (luciferase family)